MAGLTETRIKALKVPGWYAVDTTLYLRVAPGGSKQFVQRLVVRGRRVDVGLGGWPLTLLDEAREEAFRNRKIARNGGDPVAERKRRDNIPMFREAVQKVIALHEGTWKNPKQKKKEWETSFALHVLPTLGHLRVCDVQASDVLRVVERLWTTKHETAQKIKRRIGSVLDWSMTQGYRSDNPVNALKAVLPKADSLRGNFKMIPHTEVQAAIETTKASTAFLSTKLCFEFQILTACRSQEVRGMEWQECNLKTATWEIPAERTKTGKPHRVPLSDRALEILREQQAVVGDSPLVFPAPRGGVLSDATVSKMVRTCGIDGVPHAIARACFRSWCADVNVSREVAEACLAHVVKGVEGAYQRSDLFQRRRSVMEKWGDYVGGKQPAKVVSIR